MVHIVAYDLKTPNDTEEDYQKIIEGIKRSFSTWCHVEQSVWLIESSDDAASVRDLLKRYVHRDDILLVARLSGNWASFNFGEKRNQWLKGRTF